MTGERVLSIHLHEGLRTRAQAGQHNFLRQVENVVRAGGFTVEYRDDSLAEMAASSSRPGWALFHMADPFHDRALTFRRVYEYPFWAIERSAKRWEWPVARTAFDPDPADADEARRFAAYWRKRLFGAAATPGRGEGLVYVPLQGRLLQHRSFQSMSPLDMLTETLARSEGRPTVAALHPGETYSDEERAALTQLAQRNPGLTIVTGGMKELLPRADLVVTQNSSVAFFGLFFHKPAILFAKIDFHHVCANVDRAGVDSAFDEAATAQRDYDGYIHWFWQKMSVNAGRPEAPARIETALRRAGLPLGA